MPDLSTLLGGGVGVGLLAFILTGFKKGLDKKRNEETCDERHKSVDEKLAKVDEIHEAVIWMKAKMNGDG